jgi:hypothetical protein
MAKYQTTKTTQKSQKTQKLCQYKGFFILAAVGIFISGFAAGYFSHALKVRHAPSSIPAEPRVCEKIENIFKSRLIPDADDSAESHVHNANIYAVLAKRGCKERLAGYKQLSLDEIEVAKTIIDGLRQGDYSADRWGAEPLDSKIREVYFRLDTKELAEEFNKHIQSAARAVGEFIDTMKNTTISVSVEKK